MKQLKNKKGFTLIELVLVITILGILAVAALPQFIDVSTSAAQAARDGVVGAVRDGIALSRANDLVTNGPPGAYPAALDAVDASGGAATCSATNTCFNDILENPITDDNWAKASATTYTYNDGTATVTFTYDAAAGSFE